MEKILREENFGRWNDTELVNLNPSQKNVLIERIKQRAAEREKQLAENPQDQKIELNKSLTFKRPKLSKDQIKKKKAKRKMAKKSKRNNR